MYDNSKEMTNEHDAWQQVVKEWKKVSPLDFNSPEVTPLVRAIQLWGEHLSLLRETQEPDVANRALDEATLQYKWSMT